jgi:hypothetical protein
MIQAEADLRRVVGRMELLQQRPSGQGMRLELTQPLAEAEQSAALELKLP